MRRPRPSSAGGEFGTLRCLLLDEGSSPKAEECRLRRAEDSIGLAAGGDASNPKREGTEAANGPSLAYFDMPWLSNEAGSCAFAAVTPMPLKLGDMSRFES
jgi:hypothetical protein